MPHDRRRQDLLDRLSRPSVIVGADVPRSIIVHGETVDLREIVLEHTHVKEPDRETVLRARALADLLRDELGSRIRKMEAMAADDDEMSALFEECVGLKRAIADLSMVGRQQDFNADEITKKDVEDMKRWAKFLRRVR